MKRKLKDLLWTPQAAALCLAVVLYVLLTRLDVVGDLLRQVGGLFSPLVIGLVLAYLMNPLARVVREKLLGKMQNEKHKEAVSVAAAVITVVAALGAVVGSVVPQLVGSIQGFVGSLDENVDSLMSLLSRIGISEEYLDIAQLLDTAVDYIKRNAGEIMNTTITAGRSVGNFAIGFMLSIYFLLERKTLKEGMAHLLKTLLPAKRYEGLLRFCAHADGIVIRYIIFTLLESVIVGLANAVFMLIFGIPYAPLVSFVVGVTNLIPTFGPLIGAVVGAFILLLEEPIYAVWFLLFTVVLQLIDGYVIKPRLFGNSLGVSGLWILIAIVLGGKLFGVTGMLLAIPCAAIGVDVYVNYLLPWLESRRRPASMGKSEE